jgi:hypothetical protein
MRSLTSASCILCCFLGCCVAVCCATPVLCRARMSEQPPYHRLADSSSSPPALSTSLPRVSSQPLRVPAPGAASIVEPPSSPSASPLLRSPSGRMGSVHSQNQPRLDSTTAPIASPRSPPPKDVELKDWSGRAAQMKKYGEEGSAENKHLFGFIHVGGSEC